MGSTGVALDSAAPPGFLLSCHRGKLTAEEIDKRGTTLESKHLFDTDVGKTEIYRLDAHEGARPLVPLLNFGHLFDDWRCNFR